jgi:hypothetical protein
VKPPVATHSAISSSVRRTTPCGQMIMRRFPSLVALVMVWPTWSTSLREGAAPWRQHKVPDTKGLGRAQLRGGWRGPYQR